MWDAANRGKLFSERSKRVGFCRAEGWPLQDDSEEGHDPSTSLGTGILFPYERLLRRDRTIRPQSSNLMQWQRMLFLNSFCMLRNALIWRLISSYFFRAKVRQRAEAGVVSRKP